MLVKVIISPLTYKSYISTAKMRVIKPEVDELAKKYPRQEDAMKRQQATMELYKKAGINPMGGCIPLLIQMPIIIAMFRFFPPRSSCAASISFGPTTFRRTTACCRCRSTSPSTEIT